MGFLIKFFLVFMAVYFLMKSFGRWLLGKRTRQSSNYGRQQSRQNKQPESQENRIIEYQKKRFESSEAEDVDFVEIKDHNR